MKKLTFPDSYGHGSEPHSNLSANVLLSIREFATNADTYEASRWEAHNFFIDGKTYLVFAHNGIPCNNTEEMYEIAVVPNSTAGRGASYQGAGMAFVASYLDPSRPLLVFGSKTEEDGLSFVSGGKNEGNDWFREKGKEFTDKWIKKLSNLFGSEDELNKWNVFYIVKVDDSMSSKKTLMEEKYMAAMPFISPKTIESRKVVATCGISQIGYPHKDKKIRDSFKSVLSSKRDKNNQNNRRILSPVEYDERFMQFEETITTDIFNVEINNSHGCREIASFVADVSIKCYPGWRNGHYLLNRDEGISNITNRAYAKGGRLAHGVKPEHRGLLKFPVVCKEHEGENYSRFKDNALFFYNRLINVIPNELGLPYNEASDAFVILGVSIKEITNLRKEFNNGDVDILEFDSDMLLGRLQRRADFYCRNSEVCRNIFKAACRKASENISDNLKDWFEEHFPLKLHNTCPIYLSTRKKENKADKNTYKIYNLDLESCEEFDKNIKSGSTYKVAILDERNNRFIKASDISESPSSRGVVSIKSLNDAIDHLENKDKLKNNVDILKINYGLDDVNVVGITISNIQKSENDDWEDIPENEIRETYRHTTSFRPSKNIYLNADSVFKLGVVVDVPERTSKKGKDNKEKTKKDQNELRANPYTERAERATFRWKPRTRMVELNLKNEWVRGSFGQPTSEKSKEFKILNEVYEAIVNFCNSFHVLVENGYKGDSTKPVDELKQDLGEICDYDEADSYDYILNEMFRTFRQTDRFIVESIAKVKEIRESSPGEEHYDKQEYAMNS